MNIFFTHFKLTTQLKIFLLYLVPKIIVMWFSISLMSKILQILYSLQILSNSETSLGTGYLGEIMKSLLNNNRFCAEK